MGADRAGAGREGSRTATFGPVALGSAVRGRLATLAHEHRLDDRAVHQLERLLALLAADEHAPTTVRDPASAVDQHLADSLTALELAVVRDARSVTDLGAGAGFPGLALAAALPVARWWLLDSVTRKVSFMERAIAAMGLENARAVNARAEEWVEGRRASDLVTARAVASAPVVLEYAAPLLRLGGTVVDWRTEMSAEDARVADAAAAILGLERSDSRPVVPFAGSRSRYLYVYLKVRDTPDRFPRRPGTARKRPLGAST